MNQETIDAAAVVIENHLNGTEPAAPRKPLPVLVTQAATVLMVMPDDILDVTDDRARSVEYRYLTFGLMEKAGYTHREIAAHFKMNRENVTKALTKLKGWLDVHADTRGTYQRLQSRIL